MQQSRHFLLGVFALLLTYFMLTVGAEAALTTSKAASPTSTSVGVPTTVNYTLTVNNTSAFADEVVVTDDLPVGTTFVGMIDFRLNGSTQAPGPSPTITGNRLTWSNGGAGHQILGGQNLRIRYTVSFTAPTAGIYGSQITATDLTGQMDDPPDDPPVIAYNQARITVGSTPTLTNAFNRAPAGVIAFGNKVTFTDTLNNTGAVQADNLQVVVPMPPGWTYDGTFTPTWGGAPTGAPSINGQTLTFSGLGNLAAGGPAKDLVYRLTAPAFATTDNHNTRVYADNALSVASTNRSITVANITGVIAQQTAISNTNPVLGEVINFELTISNTGSAPADLTQIEHDFQTFFTYDQATGTTYSFNGSPFAPFQHPDNYASNPATLTWTNAGGGGMPITLNGGDTLVLHFNRIAPPNRSGAWNSRVQAMGSNFSTVTSPWTAITIDGPVYTTTLEVLTNPPQLQVLPGQIQYRITVANVGTDVGYAIPTWLAPASPTPVWSYLPGSTTALINGGSPDSTAPTLVSGRNLRWKPLTGYLLNPGDVLTIDFTVTVPTGTTPGQYPTRSSVSDVVVTSNGTLTTGDLAPVTIIAMPTLDLTMTASPSAVSKPATVTYTITVKNNSNSPGPVNTLQLVRSNPNPGGWTHVAGSTVVTWSRPQTPPNPTQAGNGTTYNIYTWLNTYGGANPGLQPGEWVTFSYQYQIAVTSPNGTYSSSCNASGSNIVDLNTGLTAPVTVDQAASATLTKTVNPTSVPSGGGVVTYTMTCQNTGAVNLTGSQWFDDLPAGFSYVPGSSERSYDNGATWTPIADPTNTSGNTWRWTTSVGTINTGSPNGPTLKIHFQAVTTPTSGTYANTARYQATQLSQFSTGPTAPVTVGTPPALSLNLSLDRASIPAGGPDRATYTLTLQNTGGTTAEHVNVRAVLPGFLAYAAGSSDLTMSIAAPAPDPLVTTSLTWLNLTDIPPGQIMTLSWQVIADTSAPQGTYYMEVSADGDGGGNFASVSTGAPPDAGVSIPTLTVTSAANVVLTAFTAEATPQGVQLRWRSGSEWRHLGYQVVRQVEGETTQRAMMDHLVGGPGNQVATRDYQWTDTAVQPGTIYAYWIEDVELGGMTTRHGPIRIQVPLAGKVQESWTAPAVAYLPPDTPRPEVALMPIDPSTQPRLTVLEADDAGITLELNTLPLQALQEEGYSRIVIPGMATIQEDGQFELPMAVTALGLPPGAAYRLDVLRRDNPLVLKGALPPVLHFSGGGAGGGPGQPAAAPTAVDPPVPAGDRAVPGNRTGAATPVTVTREGAAPKAGMSTITSGNHLAFAFGVLAAQAPFPATAAMADEAITLRDMDLVRLKLFPVQFDPGTQTITQYRRLRVRLSLDRPARLLSGSSGTAGAFDAALSALATDQGILRRWRAAEAAPAAAAAPCLPSSGLRLTVTTPGLQRIAASRLSAAGLDLSRPDRLHLHHRGAEVPLHVQTHGGTVTAVTFLADTVGNRYDDRALFDLVLADGPGRRLGTFDAQPAADAPSVPVQAQAEVAEHRFYVANTPPHEACDHWFGDYLTASHDTITVPLTLNAPTGSGQARLALDLASLAGGGNVKPACRLAVSVNGQPVGTTQWEGSRYERVSFTVDPALLQAGANTVRLSLQDSPHAAVYLDRVSLTHDGAWSSLQTLPARAAGAGAFQVTVPVDGDTSVYQVDASGTVSVGEGAVLAAGTLHFGGTAAPDRRYGLAGTPDDHVVISPRPAPAVDLLASNRQADHLIITPEAFRHEAERLAAWHTGRGLRSAVIPIESVYETFAGGHREPAAVRDFLRWAVRHWADPKPSYVLLFGDGHYDPLNWSKQEHPAPNPLPPLMTDTSMVGEVPNDTALVSLAGHKGLPSFFVGRLPVNTIGEARAAVDKLLTYGDAEGAWLQTAIGVQDDNDARFQATLERIVQETEGLSWSRFGIAQALDLKAALRQGAGLAVYVGHGSDWGWADENVFCGDDLTDWAPNGRSGLVVAANCLNGYFASPWFPGLGEAMLQLADAGASAFLGTSGFTLPANQERLTADLFRHLQAGRDVGTAMTLAKFNLFLRGDPLWSDEVSGWLLLGDPATAWRH
jgi:uncharacterized repeat protein (TIGR01451 family)